MKSILLFTLLLTGLAVQAQSPMSTFKREQIKAAKVIQGDLISYYSRPKAEEAVLFLATDVTNAYIRVEGQFLTLEDEDIETTEEKPGRKWDTATVVYGHPKFILKLSRIFPRNADGSEDRYHLRLFRKSDNKLLVNTPVVYVDGEMPDETPKNEAVPAPMPEAWRPSDPDFYPLSAPGNHWSLRFAF